MRKISINDLIEFRGKSAKSKKIFANNLKKEKIASTGSGGDYWISSLSVIGNVFKTDNLHLLNEKIDELLIKHGEADIDRVKKMYHRNLEILQGIEGFDFTSIRPGEHLEFL